MKRCRKCTITKPIDAFGVDKSRPDGHCYVCFDCMSTRTSPGPTRRERRLRSATEAWCSGCKRWLPTSEVRGGKCRAHHNAYERRNYASSEEVRYQRKLRNRFRRNKAPPVPPEGMEILMERYHGLCVYCGNPGHTIDHLVPVSRGGRTTPGNVVLACASCNSRKRCKSIDEWMDKMTSLGWPLRDELADALGFQCSSLYG